MQGMLVPALTCRLFLSPLLMCWLALAGGWSLVWPDDAMAASKAGGLRDLVRSQPQIALSQWREIDPEQLPVQDIPRHFAKGYILLRNQGERKAIDALISQIEAFQSRFPSASLNALIQLIKIEELRLAGKLFNAQYQLRQLQQSANEWNNDYIQLLVYEVSSELHKDLGQLDQAGAALERAFAWLDEHDPSQEYRRTRLLISAATLLRRSGSFSEAELNIQSALALARSAGATVDEVEALVELAHLQQATERELEANNNLLQALTLTEAIQSAPTELLVLSALATLYLQKHDFNRALSTSKRAKEVAVLSGNTLYQWIATSYQGMAEIQRGDVQSGLNTIEPALDALADTDSYRIKMTILGQLADILAQQQAYEHTSWALQEYRKVSDELQQTNQRWLLSQYQTQLEANQLRQQAAELTLRNQLKQSELEQSSLQQQRLLLFAAVLLLSVMLLVLIAQKLRLANRQLHLSNRNLAEKSRTDRLTGLLNRGALTELLFAGDRQRRHGDQPAEDGILFLIDVDHFKQINDTWGHAAGDEVLKQLAHSLTECMRATDHVARWGGEEFVIVAPGADLQQGLILADKLLHTIHARETLVGHRSLQVSVSIGLTTLSAGADQSAFERQLAIADAALYYAKQQGRNRAIAVLSYQLKEKDWQYLTERFGTLLENARIQIGTVTGPAIG